MKRAAIRPIALPRSPSLLLSLGAALILLLAWMAFMLPEWINNPDLSHGLISPLLIFILIREARVQGCTMYFSSVPGTLVLTGLLLAATLATVTFAGLMAAALSWSNHLTLFLFGVSMSLLLGATWVVSAREEWRLVPVAWPAFVACLIPVLCAPFPPGTYSRLTLALQLAVTRGVIGSLHLLGIPARQSGNIIELAGTSVGVEEACSGVRSLVSCVVAALFFSGTLVSRPLARTALILLSVPLALVMNFFRSLGLTLAAENGINIAGAVHTVSGYLGLLLCAFVLAVIARALGRRPPLPARNEPGSERISSAPARLLLAGTATVALVLGFFMAKTRPAPIDSKTPPDLASLLPSSFPGWRVETTNDLYRFSSTLQTSHLAQRTYLRDSATGIEQITVYLAYWAPRQASVSLVSSHTPDACWPGAGWKSLEDRATRASLTVAGTPLPSAEYRTFKHASSLQHVWFWHLHNGVPVTDTDPFSPFKMARVVVRYGVQSESDQAFIRFSSNTPWADLVRDPLIEEIFRRLRPLGL
ncbi:MAG: exosortase-associated EpsI family protein [Opitutaceae bacterium]|nr:exosortase-associated EpsI family protein [Opitutaceae bacterium]